MKHDDPNTWTSPPIFRDPLPEHPDDLNPARGRINGTALAIILWALILGVAWWVR